MKILHVLYSGLGGHGNVFISFVNGDTEHEFEIGAIFNGTEKVREEYIQFCKTAGIQWDYVKKKYKLDITYYSKIISAIKKSNAQIIFLHSSSYILPAIMANCLSNKNKKIVVRETQANHLKTKSEWLWLSLAIMFADKIIFLTEQYCRQIEKKLHWIYKKNKVKVIPNGIDLKLYSGQIRLSEQEIVIGMQSRITYIKDHTTLLKAFQILKQQQLFSRPLKLRIAGDGDCKASLIILAQQLKIEDDVEFTGMLNEVELIKFLKSLDLYVHASLGETMSTAIMQAMASYLPIIASDVNGINNMIQDNYNGLLVPVKDENILAEKIKAVLNGKELSFRLSANAYKYAEENFSNIRMTAEYKEVFYNLF